MFQSFKTLAALALVASGSAAHATLTLTQNLSFNTSTTSATDYSANPVQSLFVAQNGRSTALNFNGFNTNLGVLVGAQTTVNTSNSLSVSVNGLGPGMNGDARAAVGSGSTSSNLYAGGNSGQTVTTSSSKVRCGDDDYRNYTDAAYGFVVLSACPQSATKTWNDQLSLNATNNNGANLSAYLSPSAVSLPTIVTADLERRDEFYQGSAWATASVAQSGTASLVYSYLQHANASFSRFTDQNTLTLDFGDVLQGSIIPSLQYSLFNLGGSDTINMTVNGVSGGNNRFTNAVANAAAAPSGQISTFNTQGGLFTARMMTDTLGDFGTAYFLRVGDSNIGGAGMQESVLTLILRGRVIAADITEEVPEPAMLGLFGLGALGLAVVRRRRA